MEEPVQDDVYIEKTVTWKFGMNVVLVAVTDYRTITFRHISPEVEESTAEKHPHILILVGQTKSGLITNDVNEPAIRKKLLKRMLSIPPAESGEITVAHATFEHWSEETKSWFGTLTTMPNGGRFDEKTHIVTKKNYPVPDSIFRNVNLALDAAVLLYYGKSTLADTLPVFKNLPPPGASPQLRIMGKHWIQKAIPPSHEGRFTAWNTHHWGAGKLTYSKIDKDIAYGKKTHNTHLVHQAQLAKTLKHMHH
jgi:hypothetical protein